MRAEEIRRRFLQYFAEHGHTLVPSSSLIPYGDPTLLFTNAGMVQFKDIFLGREAPPYPRASSAQRCVRAGGKHNDLDQVGRTARHHTFFEMLGNFSFGDYFKQGAMELAYTLLIKVFKLDPERLYYTVYEADDEAHALWQTVAGVGPERVVRLGAKDNFWSMGDTGPCGPCSEIFYDRGASFRCSAPQCALGVCDCDRWLEVWNLVFMQYDRAADGTLQSLPHPSIDTGMGLERMASILQGVASNFETDLFMPIIGAISQASSVPYAAGPEGFAHRVVADHLRACVCLVADGVRPANEGRGYVLRRILRRAMLVARSIGLEEPFLSKLVPVVIASIGQGYPGLIERQEHVQQVLHAEEQRFGQTLTEGNRLLNSYLVELKRQGARTLTGERAFELYDTYGFPYDLTEELALEQGVEVDRLGYERALAEQRTRARAARQIDHQAQALHTSAKDLPATAFTGYERLQDEGRVLLIFAGAESAAQAEEGQDVVVVLDRTPFYPEGGGQVGDRGTLLTSSGVLQVEDTRKLGSGRIAHFGVLRQGELRVDQAVVATVDEELRRAAERNHTATHLLHRALHLFVGEHATQAGSVVEPARLRFDFSHHEALTPSQLENISHWVNAHILQDLPVRYFETSLDQAKSLGAMALFTEKYQDQVRVLEVGEVSRELCGGTHVRRTGEIGAFVLTDETGIGSGLRRIEAVTGFGALSYLHTQRQTVERLSAMLGAPPELLASKLSEELQQRRILQQNLESLRREATDRAMDQLIAHSHGPLTLGQLPDADLELLRRAKDRWQEQVKSGVLVLVGAAQQRVDLLVAVSSDLIAQGIQAPDLLRPVATLLGGKGGGRPDLAQGGGKEVGQLIPALQLAERITLEALGKIH